MWNKAVDYDNKVRWNGTYDLRATWCYSCQKRHSINYMSNYTFGMCMACVKSGKGKIKQGMKK